MGVSTWVVVASSSMLRSPVQKQVSAPNADDVRSVRIFFVCPGWSRRSPALLAVGGGIQERPGEVFVKFLLGVTVGCRVEDAPEVFVPEVTVWRVVVNEVVGDILGPLKLYLV